MKLRFLTLVLIPAVSCASSHIDNFQHSIDKPDPDVRDPSQYEMAEVLGNISSKLTLTIRRAGIREKEAKEIRLALSGKKSGFAVRIERRAEADRALFFLDYNIPYGDSHLYAGYFMPDIALGLGFAGYRFSYPFSGGYPIRRYKWITKHTSFFGGSVRGAALKAGAGIVRIMIFAGEPGKWKDEVFVTEKGYINGIRVEAGTEKLKAGMTVSGVRGLMLAGADCRVENRSYVQSAEVCISNSGRLAVSWGWRRKSGNYRQGFLIFRVPSGLGNRYGDIPGGIGNDSFDRTGISLVSSWMVRRGRRLKLAFEHRRDDSGSRTRILNLSKVEYSLIYRGSNIKVAWSKRNRSSTETVPFPPVAKQAVSNPENANILFTSRDIEPVRARLLLRYSWSRDYSGYIFSPSIRIRSSSRRMICKCFFSIYRSCSGRAVFYSYEPVIAGSYPWKYLAGNGMRGGVMCTLKTRNSSLLVRTAMDGHGKSETDIQWIYNY